MSKLLVCNFKYVWCCETLPKLTRYYIWNYIYPLHKFFNLSSTIYLITNVKLKSFWVVSSLSTFVGHTSTQELFGLLCSASHVINPLQYYISHMAHHMMLFNVIEENIQNASIHCVMSMKQKQSKWNTSSGTLHGDYGTQPIEAAWCIFVSDK